MAYRPDGYGRETQVAKATQRADDKTTETRTARRLLGKGMNPLRFGLPLLFVALFDNSIAAQAAVIPYGFNTCGTPLQVAGQPHLGQTITIVGTGSIRVGHQLVNNWLVFGASAQSWQGQALPLPLPALFPNITTCGDLLTSPDVFVLMPEVPFTSTTAAIPIAIPSAAWLIGFTFHVQTIQEIYCFGYCAPASWPAAIGSNGVFVRIGV
ncbi:MAG TPA: hypothetical protein VF128_11500 [Gemmatimonadaceae bacterium]